MPPADTAPAIAPITFGQIRTTTTDQCITQTAPQSQTQIITEQVEAVPAVFAPDERVLTPPVFRTQSRPATTTINAATQFETLCPAEYTLARAATLQRARKARGKYDGVITGVLDTATGAAIRAFLAPLGFGSTHIARSVAESLGVVPIAVLPTAVQDT